MRAAAAMCCPPCTQWGQVRAEALWLPRSELWNWPQPGSRPSPLSSCRVADSSLHASVSSSITEDVCAYLAGEPRAMLSPSPAPERSCFVQNGEGEGTGAAGPAGIKLQASQPWLGIFHPSKRETQGNASLRAATRPGYLSTARPDCSQQQKPLFSTVPSGQEPRPALLQAWPPRLCGQCHRGPCEFTLHSPDEACVHQLLKGTAQSCALEGKGCGDTKTDKTTVDKQYGENRAGKE